MPRKSKASKQGAAVWAKLRKALAKIEEKAKYDTAVAQRKKTADAYRDKIEGTGRLPGGRGKDLLPKKRGFRYQHDIFRHRTPGKVKTAFEDKSGRV